MINITFERSYPTALATSPLLPMLLLSLATQRNNPKQATQFKQEYDYIIDVDVDTVDAYHRWTDGIIRMSGTFPKATLLIQILSSYRSC
ncbi:hypothetical protein CEXT_53791 [Caerostris extrusa]|uniref:Uncharacterized protein n=1 Tax=Caerostris extrusa TaxID=172846 RepID=A0AAV4V8C3_CAEEX|nr:hypothetical protein CEXT_53791 [Caerostris extrusa]